jgi:predicted alpha/beta hydrolase
MSTTMAPVVPAAAATAVSVEEVRFPTRDGRTLVGRLYHPPASPDRLVVVHGGVGFPARYYQDFARWLADGHQAAVLTYDYRDFGWSLDRPLVRSEARLRDWAITDQSAALSFAVGRFPRLRPRILGHSLGGQWLAFHEEVGRIERAAAVASGPAYWRDHPWPMWPQVLAFWWLLGPAAARLAGYLPGRRLGLGADIPAGIYWEWRALCLRPGYHRPEWGRAYPQPALDAARFDLTIIPVADDMLIAPDMVRKLPGFYPRARVSETLLDPAALGLRAIGHGGAFLPRNQACWARIAAALI